MTASFEQPTFPDMPDPAKPEVVNAVPDESLPIAPEILEYPDRTSEAARDQGWGPTEWGTPVGTEDRPVRTKEAVEADKQARRERRERAIRRASRETRYTDIGSDTQGSDKAPDDGTIVAPKDSPGRRAAARVLAAIEAKNIITETGNDTARAMAIARARQEKPKS